MNFDLSCPYCEMIYDRKEIKPYSLDCGCTCCKKCLDFTYARYSTSFCPMCKISIHEPNIDQNIYSKLTSQEQKCILHGEPLDCYCSLQNVYVCSNCKKHYKECDHVRVSNISSSKLPNSFQRKTGGSKDANLLLEDCKLNYENMLIELKNKRKYHITMVKETWKELKDRVYVNLKKISKLSKNINETNPEDQISTFKHWCNLYAIQGIKKEMDESFKETFRSLEEFLKSPAKKEVSMLPANNFDLCSKLNNSKTDNRLTIFNKLHTCLNWNPEKRKIHESVRIKFLSPEPFLFLGFEMARPAVQGSIGTMRDMAMEENDELGNNKTIYTQTAEFQLEYSDKIESKPFYLEEQLFLLPKGIYSLHYEYEGLPTYSGFSLASNSHYSITRDNGQLYDSGLILSLLLASIT